jgi:hypothetical protein
MTQAQAIWLLLIISALIVNLPLIGFIKYFFIERKIMATLSQFQPVLDQLSALVGPVTSLKAAADAGANAVTAQDIADTVVAVQTAVNAIATAAGQPTQ